MKNKTHYLYYQYNPRGPVSVRSNGWITIALLLFSVAALAQEQTPPPVEFMIGSNLSGLPWRRTVQNYYDSFDSSGMNIVFQYSNSDTKGQLNDYEVIGTNFDSNDWIGYYATCYYTKWEAEQNQEDPLRVGVKHNRGQNWVWHDTLSWSTFGIASTDDSLMFGPHYRQDNRYKSWQHGDRHDVDYYVRFNMALHNPLSVDPNRNVCRIKVVYRYTTVYSPTYWVFNDTVFLERTLKVGDFPEGGYFQYFYFDPVQYYEYPAQFILPKYAGKMDPALLGYPRFEDSNSDNGIQFWVEWLVPDAEESGLALFVDKVEVYDRDWKEKLIDRNPEISANEIRYYAGNYSGWDNLKYWAGHDEPYSIDAFAPIRIVDSILYNNPQLPHKHRLIQTFNPYWTYDDKINGDTLLSQYYRMANPEKLFIDFYPFSPSYPFRGRDAEALRFRFQLCHQLQPGFWYMGQGVGQSKDIHDPPVWDVWRLPDSSELKTSVMLALAHGSRGILFFMYDSWGYPGEIYGGDTSYYYLHGLVDTLQSNGTIPVSDLWYLIRDNLAPRLKGKLGNTLMSIDYTGVYLQLRRYFNEPGIVNTNPTVNERYLTLTEYIEETPPPPVHFHAGFFIRPSYVLDNYFMLDNLITTGERKVWVILERPVTGFENYRFRNVEGLFDTTFTNSGITKLITYSPGEGYLYQVAPVVVFGGKLIFDETISSEKTLIDDMTIKNGKTLTVNTTYNADRSITITEGGRLVTTSGGTIKFYNDENLIIEGTATISGTPQNKLVLDFLNPAERNGIIIRTGGSLTISNCIIKNAGMGIYSELNANYINEQNVDFVDCSDYSINIAGRSPGQSPTPPPQIKNCTMLNSDYGISVINLPGILILDNDITNTALGIYLSNVTDAQIIGNTIISNRQEMAGIYFQSSGNFIRANLISGHSVGLHLANAAPILGSNLMTLNKYHGLYIGKGSLPYMRQGKFIGQPPNFYATSGYNKIYNNGGYEDDGGPEDNDGSEIYFTGSNAWMSKGCNSIYDDREPIPPLVNTYLLMNCPSEEYITIDAIMNYWSQFVEPERFGNLNVEYIPYSESPCPEPQSGSGEAIVQKTSFGDVIDTVYSVEVEIPQMTQTEEDYAEAEGYFLTGDLTNALQMYNGIINSTATEEEKYFAYERKYSIGKLTGQSTEFFNELSSTFSTLASNTQDTLNNKILNQYSTLSKVGEQEYVTAISEYDNIVLQNPNTEEAVYAEIDALTTARLIEEPDSTLNKGRLGKYLIKSVSDYNQKVDEILRKHFGSESKENEGTIIPTEFTLYQNYPNPFNSTTTIKYDLPFASDVSLIIYDILGRKVKELVNTKQQAGRYEVQFDATNLSSGVYIYQLISEKYINSKKMILLK